MTNKTHVLRSHVFACMLTNYHDQCHPGQLIATSQLIELIHRKKLRRVDCVELIVRRVDWIPLLFLDITVLMSAARYPMLLMIIQVLDELLDFLKSTDGALRPVEDIY